MSAVAAPTPPKEDVARENSWDCVVCGHLVNPGDPIRELTCPKVWVHSGCATDYEGDDFDDDNTNGVESASKESTP